MKTTEHRVQITEDDDGRAYGECRQCCWAVSGSVRHVEDKADEHEASS